MNDIYVSFGADSGGLEAAFALAKAQTKDLASEMNALAREMAKTGATADSEVAQKLTAVGAQFAAAKAHAAELRGELGAVGKEGAGGISGLLASITETRESLAGMAELFAGAFAVEKLVEFVKGMGELGEKTERTAAILGITAEQVGQMQYAFAATGTDAGNIDQMFGRLEATLSRAASGGTSPATAGLKALGLSAKELVGIPLPEQMAKIADATSKFADGVNKTAALQTLGRGMVELIPLLDQGGEGFARLKKTADETNSVLDAMTTESLVAMQHAFVEAGAAIKGVGIETFKPFADVIANAAKEVTQLAEAFSNSVKEGGPFNAVLNEIADAMRVVLTAGEGVISIISASLAVGTATYSALGDDVRGFGTITADVFKALGEGIPGFFKALVDAGREAVKAIGQYFTDLGSIIGDVLKLNFSAASDAAGKLKSDLDGSLGKIGGSFAGVFNFSEADAAAKATSDKIAGDFKTGYDRVIADAVQTKERMKAIWGSSETEETKKSEKQVPNLNLDSGKGAKDAANAAEATATAEIDEAKRADAKIQDGLDNRLKLHQISMSQWLSQSLAAYDTEYNAVKAAYDKELSVAGLTSAQKIAIANKEQNALADIAKKEADAQTKAAEDSAKSWDSAMKTINGAFDAQINGLLTGTESWGTAMRKVFVSLTEDVIKFFVDWGMKEAEKVARTIILGNTEVAAHVAGNTAKEASDASAGAAGFAVEAASITKSILASAGEAFSGVFGFLSPVMGPAAAGPAAAAEATVAAMVPSMAVGGYVLSDGLINAHAGETVTPANVATPYAGGGSAGARGVTHNHTWNVSSNSSSPRDVAREVAKLWDANPSMRPAY